MPKLGCSLKLAALLILVIFALVIISLIGGALGNSLFGETAFSVISVPQPKPELPAEKIGHIGPFAITNSILATWLSMAVLIAIALAARKKMSFIPRGIQNIFEAVIERLLNFVEGVAGHEWGRRFLPIVATIFLFVIVNAWISLLPGFGSILIEEGGHEVHLLRGANTDINTPLAIALVSFAFVEYMGVLSLGFFPYLGKFVRVKTLLKGQILTGFIDLFVGILETLSELIRIVSFTFRLFGNMLAGEILLLVVFFLLPWGIAPIFYGLELLVGFVQALIFSGLTLVFVTLAVAPHEHGH